MPLLTLVIPCGSAISSIIKFISRVIKIIIYTEEQILHISSVALRTTSLISLFNPHKPHKFYTISIFYK